MCVDGVMKFHAKPWTLPEGTHGYRKRPTKTYTHTYTHAASERRFWCIHNKGKTGKERPRAHHLFPQYRVVAAVAFKQTLLPSQCIDAWLHH